MPPDQPLKTFIIYARKDESFKDDLLLHLRGTLIATGHLQVWQDGDILPGEEWEKQIERNLDAADLFLVLLSIHSLTSTFIQQKELVKVLEKKSRIVPILVRNCFWQNHPTFAGLQGLPKNMKPVASFADPDDAWTEVMERLHEMVEGIRAEARKQTDAAFRQKEKEAADRAEAARKKQEADAAAQKRQQEEVEHQKWLPEMIHVKGGTFQMGDEKGDLWEGCRPVHDVTLSDFEIGKCQVTQKLWMAIMGSNPSHFKGEDLPVEQVSWDDCQEFIKKLNEKTGKKYRLPTEAEWEFAARGGMLSKGFLYAGSNDLQQVGWFTENAGEKTHPVGQKTANEIGIYDLSGNVWEWCVDWYDTYSTAAQNSPIVSKTGTRRILRGGSWFNDEQFCRIPLRGNNGWPEGRDNNVGFRLASSPQ